MNSDIHNDYIVKPYAGLPPATAFEYNESVYIKLRSPTDIANCLNITTGGLTYIDPSKHTIPLTGRGFIRQVVN